MLRRTKTTIAAASGVLAVGVGLGVAGVASAAPTTNPTPGAGPSVSSPADPSGGGGRGHGRGDRDPGQRAQELATKLGVDQTKVADALKAFRQANKPTAPPTAGATRPDPAVRDAALATSLASALGVDEAKVTTALTELRTARQSEHAAALKTRLDAAVKAGTLTRAEADAVTKAVDKGVIHAGGR
ncbi:MAG: hypothetical protein JWP61_132 [Friedmanniella sp.]|nr:hypothetical protein [Friedmanniella sp.]